MMETKIRRWSRGVAWPTLTWIVLLHLGALAAPFFFTWKGLALGIALYIVTGLGICVGYHRYFTHKAFHTGPGVANLLALLGSLAGEGPVIQWVAQHRKHHAHADREGDPHSPKHGPWWAHMLWFLPRTSKAEEEALRRRWAPDLLKNRVFRLLDQTYLLWHLALGFLLLAVGTWLWDWRTGVSLLLWGMAVRIVFLLHATWAVNSASHMWGYKTYPTPDNSRNNWWVALISFGEGWHNNHHAFPALAKHGHHRWWELDPGYWVIRLLELTGLVWGVYRDPGQRKPVPSL